MELVFREEVEDDLLIELVPLEGEEEGSGSFFGSICSQWTWGNLEASETSRRTETRAKNMHFCLHKTNDAILTVRVNVNKNDQVIRKREGKMIYVYEKTDEQYHEETA